MEDEKLAQLGLAFKQSAALYDDYLNRIKAAIQAFETKLMADTADECMKLVEERRAAGQALSDYRKELANAKAAAFTPVRVYRVEVKREYSQWRRVVVEHGQIEIFKPGDETPENVSSKPSLGSKVIRHIKKDGSRAKKVTTIYQSHDLPDGWFVGNEHIGKVLPDRTKTNAPPWSTNI